MGLLGKVQAYYNKRKLESKLKLLGRIGEFCDIQSDVEFVFPERIQIGSYIYIGPGGIINGLGGVEIGSGTIIGPRLFAHSANHKYKDSEYLPYDQYQHFKKIIIEENVWIGGNVCIVPGTKIGEGSIVGMGCVVSGNIPPLSIVIGNPCKVVSMRDREHYDHLKREGKIYMKAKLRGDFSPDYLTGFESKN